jgi:hypothetical protein
MKKKLKIPSSFKQPYGTLVFPLPEHKEDFEAALRGDLYRGYFQSFDNWLRSLAKHENKKSIEISVARDKINELCDGKLHE